MTTIALAQKRWESKMAKAGPRWKTGVADKTGAYKKAIGDFAGVPAGPTMAGNWADGVGMVTAEDFATAVRGKGPKWAEKLRSAIAG